MGLFSSKKIVSVASTIYNLAGDERDRPDYLKSLVVRNVLSGTKQSLGESIHSGYMNGPGVKLRSFYRWAEQNYKAVGMPMSSFQTRMTVAPDLAAKHIPVAPGKTAWVQAAYLDQGDYGYWVDKWMLENFPAQFNDSNWIADFDENAKVIRVTLADGSVHSFTPEHFDQASDYVFAYYMETSGETLGPRTTGRTVTIGAEPFPSTAGWSLMSTDAVNRTAALQSTTTVVREYANGRPTDRTTTEGTDNRVYQVTTRNYQREVSTTTNTDGRDVITARREYQQQVEDFRVIRQSRNTTTYEGTGTERVTITTMITEDVMLVNGSYRIDTQPVTKQEWGPMRVFIYKIGWGIQDLDQYATFGEEQSGFYPVIPVRIENQPVTEDRFANLAQEAAKAYKKSMGGGSFKSLLDNIEKNEKVGDIDNAYIVFGVSINTREMTARKYMWEFFSLLMRNQATSAQGFEAWQREDELARESHRRWEEWRAAQAHESYPGHGSAEPVRMAAPDLPINTIRLNNTGHNISYQVTLNWNYISQGSRNTNEKKVGELWFEGGTVNAMGFPLYTGVSSTPGYDLKTYDRIYLCRQTTPNRVDYLTIVGLLYTNTVYQGHAVKITSIEGISDEEESGFIIPLHYDTLRRMSLKDSTQMSTVCAYLVLNSYEIKKQRWYQRGIFKVFLIVAFAIASVVFTGGAGIGLLGSHAAVGGYFGLSGMTAAIVGSVANAMAALVLTTVIEQVTGAIFGEVLGGIIASVIGGLVATGTISMNLGTGLTANWGQLMRVDNLLKMTNAVGKGYQSYIAGSIRGMQEDLMKMQENAASENQRVNEAYIQEFGYGRGNVDPLMSVGAAGGILVETRDTFLTRTLMTGSDVADMSMDMISNFAELTLKLPDAFS